MSIEEIYEAVKSETSIKSYKITKEKDDSLTIFDSKFGGVPYWDFSKEYPVDSKGEKLNLLAQINFDKEKFDDDRLPKTGLLQFFISGKDESYGMDFSDQVKQSDWRVIYHENVNYEMSEDEVRNNGVKTFKELEDCYPPLKDEYKISFTETEDVMSCFGLDFNEVFVKLMKDKFNIDVDVTKVDDYLESIDPKYYIKFETYGHKLLGYPAFTQYDPREKSKYNKYDTLLLQIDSEDDIMWGDSGIANFFISEEDLKNKNFEDMLYNWDCC